MLILSNSIAIKIRLNLVVEYKLGALSFTLLELTRSRYWKEEITRKRLK